MAIVTIGTVLAIPGDVIFFTSNGLALGTEQTITVPDPPIPPFDNQPGKGKYRPLTWPAHPRPWKA